MPEKISDKLELIKNIAVIGGGASGLIAAYFASGAGHRVVLFEKQKKLGRKILVSGNGRCNISNRNIDVSNYHGSNPKFTNNILSRFGTEDTENFFKSIGLPVTEEKNGRLFPASLQSSTVVNFLSYELKKKGVEILLHRKVEKIGHVKDEFTLVTAGREEHKFNSVILAAGNCSHPQLGGTMLGLELAESLGHSVHQPFPAILPINVPLKALHRLQGVKWDCSLSVKSGGSEILSSRGDLLFTGFGISGTAALEVSRTVNSEIIKGGSPEIEIDFFPLMTEDELYEKMKTILSDKGKKLSFSLAGILNDRLPEIILSICGIDPQKRAGSISEREIISIVKSFKSFTVLPGKPRPFNEAVVAAGGVSVDEINPSSMESKIVKNLFITGELLDIDGDSGGYNLQFAWSTGAIAGMSQ